MKYSNILICALILATSAMETPQTRGGFSKLWIEPPSSDASTADSDEENSFDSPQAEEVFKKLGSPSVLIPKINALSEDKIRLVKEIENRGRKETGLVEEFARDNPDLFSSLVEYKLQKNLNLSHRRSEEASWKKSLERAQVKEMSGFDPEFEFNLRDAATNTSIRFFVSFQNSKVVLEMEAFFADWKKMKAFPEEVLLEMLKNENEVWKLLEISLTKGDELEIARLHIVNPLSVAILERVEAGKFREMTLWSMPNATNSLNLVQQLNASLGIRLRRESIRAEKEDSIWNAYMTFTNSD